MWAEVERLMWEIEEVERKWKELKEVELEWLTLEKERLEEEKCQTTARDSTVWVREGGRVEASSASGVAA